MVFRPLRAVVYGRDLVFVAQSGSDSCRVLMTAEIYALVWGIAKRIPRGRVATYGQLAALLGMPKHARQVGYALSASPGNMKIAWHRVVNAEGRISLRLKHWETGSDDLQRILLEAEGIKFDDSGRIELKKFRWHPK